MKFTIMLPLAVYLTVTFQTLEGSTSLIRSVMDTVLHHPDNQACFDNVIYPLIRDQPHVFGAIMHKLLGTPPGDHQITEDYELAFKLLQCFMHCAPGSFIQNHIKFMNGECSNEDHWKFFRFCNDFHVYFWKYIESVIFAGNNSSFAVIMNWPFRYLVISRALSITIYPGEEDINWATIPSFLVKLTIRYEPDDFRTVNLSLIDPRCALESLTIRVSDGYIHLPSYPLPVTLNTLKLYHYPSDLNSTAYITDYEELQIRARHLCNITVHENSRSFAWNTLNNVLLSRRLNGFCHENTSQIGENGSKLIKFLGGSITLLTVTLIVLCIVGMAQIDTSH